MDRGTFYIVALLTTLALTGHHLIWSRFRGGWRTVPAVLATLILANLLALAVIKRSRLGEYPHLFVVSTGLVVGIALVIVRREGRSRLGIGYALLAGLVLARLLYDRLVGGYLPTDL